MASPVLLFTFHPPFYWIFCYHFSMLTAQIVNLMRSVWAERILASVKHCFRLLSDSDSAALVFTPVTSKKAIFADTKTRDTLGATNAKVTA